MRLACALDSIDTPIRRWQDRPSTRGGSKKRTHTELAWEFADLFGELAPDQINEMLAKNVPMDMLQFFTDYARTFAEREEVGDAMQKRIPNLMLLGYLLRLLEERLIDGEDIGHA